MFQDNVLPTFWESWFRKEFNKEDDGVWKDEDSYSNILYFICWGIISFLLLKVRNGPGYETKAKKRQTWKFEFRKENILSRMKNFWSLPKLQSCRQSVFSNHFRFNRHFAFCESQGFLFVCNILWEGVTWIYHSKTRYMIFERCPLHKWVNRMYIPFNVTCISIEQCAEISNSQNFYWTVAPCTVINFLAMRKRNCHVNTGL